MSPPCHYFRVNRTDRLYALREELRRAGQAGRTAERLAETMEVSVRTIKRDISTLQHGGFPVWSRPGPGGGYVVDRHATLPPVNFTEAEVTGLAAAVAAHRGQPFEEHARSVLTKVSSVMDPAARERAAALTDRVWIDTDGDRVDTRSRRALEQALSERRVLSLQYGEPDVTEPLRTRVDPVLMARTRGHWYLVGYCRSSERLRWFRTDHITQARLTVERAADIPVESVGAPPATARSLTDP